MKKLVPLGSIALLLPLVPSLAWAGFGNGVPGSPHDFSVETWNDRKEVCLVGHVPHDHQRTLYQNGLLWNHAVSAAAYTLYESSTMDVPVIQPEGPSSSVSAATMAWLQSVRSTAITQRVAPNRCSSTITTRISGYQAPTTT